MCERVVYKYARTQTIFAQFHVLLFVVWLELLCLGFVSHSCMCEMYICRVLFCFRFSRFFICLILLLACYAVVSFFISILDLWCDGDWIECIPQCRLLFPYQHLILFSISFSVIFSLTLAVCGVFLFFLLWTDIWTLWIVSIVQYCWFCWWWCCCDAAISITR